MKLQTTTLLALCLLMLLVSPALCAKTGGKKETKKETLKQKISGQKVPLNKAPGQKVPLNKAPGQKVPLDKVPVNKVSGISAKKPLKKVPLNKISGISAKKPTKKVPLTKKRKVVEKKCKGDATYTIETDCKWTRKTHPIAYPKNAHLSPLCGTVHSKNYFLWRLNDQARNGAKEIAETGMCNSATDEIRTCQNQVPPACEEAFSFPCSNKSGACKHEGEVTATPEHTYVSFQAMVAPSPDWSIGVDALQLCVDGEWRKEYEESLYPLDMGTDEGLTFKAKNQPNGLRRPISRFDPKDKSSIFYNKAAKKTFPICKVVITLQK